MKIEIEKDFPQYFKPSYPEEFELFSHFEVSAGIPTVLFAITTWKENGKPNVCFHSWSCFHGDKTAFFAVMGNLYQHTHTYANIKREKCFCINFLPISYYDKLVDTIKHNDMETDEFAVGHFTLSNAKTIHAPVIQEAFINMECTLKETQDLSGAGIAAMPKFQTITDQKSIEKYGGSRMYFAPPIDYDKVMKLIPYGKVITVGKIREYFAELNGADFTEPITAGIFVSIAAWASYQRSEDETPYWRTLKANGELNAKYPGGIEAQKEKLEAEGHTIIQKGRTNIKYFVKDYESVLFDLR